ncbi:hypothetical protein DT076_06170 [Desertihabitans brevis]|uniref:Alpha/beta hydrolase n=1 Tax=Desertihabitans brevis TaxID=2268447 RepID=A0A367YWQ1_9ACTN|nr:hypothetical protein [Desertihabitans brevis]RCK70248.1 hypothetical protein DT076_06170 [Desertihabitans brevis]
MIAGFPLAEIVVGAVALLLLLLMTAPFEALWWWSQQEEPVQRRAPREVGPAPTQGTTWIVYLAGVGTASSESSRPEQPLLDRLRNRLGDEAVLVTGVFPYSVLDHGLTTDRDLSWLWRVLDRMQRRKWPVLPLLINLYNVFQVLVSADRRYGPFFSLAMARTIWGRLRAAGYQSGSGDPVVLLGWSGGGQICLGASWYLADQGAPVYVLSLGGVLSSDPGLDRVRHLWHLHGSRDRVHRLGALLFPSRWPTSRDSSWNRAKREGRITTTEIGPYTHSSSPSYLTRRPQPDGSVPIEVTTEALLGTLAGAGLLVRDRAR